MESASVPGLFSSEFEGSNSDFKKGITAALDRMSGETMFLYTEVTPSVIERERELSLTDSTPIVPFAHAKQLRAA